MSRARERDEFEPMRVAGEAWETIMREEASIPRSDQRLPTG